MGLHSFIPQGRDAHRRKRLWQERFGAHFPRLFAYAVSWMGDPAAARDVTVEAFQRTLVGAADAPDGEFRVALLDAARRLCRSARPRRRGALSPREREVLSLLFDAQLSRGEIARLLQIKESSVGAFLVRGLRKLRDQAPPAMVAAHLQRL